MEQYFSATHRMEQEVMFPSLLRGVFPQQHQQRQQQDGAAPDADGHTDLYERYQQLKAIKPMVEKGLASVNDQSSSSTDADADTAEDEGVDSNLEERLSHHVNGLQQVLTDLTKNTKALTRRYSQILEEINLSDDKPSS
ncbi:mid1-interacting protein 1-B-like [Pezoporus wallicus]|uniref:mid1-interacting protein 1-B-like n=1 Tax=Pezoporus wallicus TaxID=35540 RepID=UPI00254C769E|nr:mid1-interacting protein 1-B-like [Pezoporus wallicus]